MKGISAVHPVSSPDRSALNSRPINMKDDIPDLVDVEPEGIGTIVAGAEERKAGLCPITDAYKVYSETSLYKAMKPLFISLKIVGLYHSRNYGSVTECMKKVECNQQGTSHKPLKVTKRNVSVSQVYSWFIFIVLLLGFIRMIPMYIGNFSFSYILFTKLMVHTYVLLCVLGNVAFLRASHRYEGLPKFFIEWDTFLNETLT